MLELKEGFYTALGTPLDEQGNIVADSLTRQIEQQIIVGASGLLFLGSMGAQCSVRTDQCKVGAQVAAQAVAGRVPLFVGVMDNGVERVLERIADLEGLPLQGVVLTTPYYFICDPDSIVSYFTKIAARSPFPVYLYDLPVVTK
ncbi:MAG: dihydrodipicolinate synthase family protein, partial [Planctomycetia bacterium]|nr:dihydrodipicolinate synthase family protein [Planctomycetia bacterium]